MQDSHAYYVQYRRPRKIDGKIAAIVAAILVIAVLGTLVALQRSRLNSKTDESNTQSIREEVAEIMMLPDEEAAVSEISDATSVRTMGFFSNAENGDQVLVFADAAKIVLYRPSTRQIVNAGPIYDDSEAE